MTTGSKHVTDEEIVKASNKHGTVMKAADSLGIAKSTYHDRLQKIRSDVYREQKMMKPVNYKALKGVTQRFILSSAQDGTAIHTNFVENLEAYAEYLDAEIIISGFTYNKNVFVKDRDPSDSMYHKKISPYITDRRINIGKKLSFCGEMNILPTAVRPMSGMDSYTQDRDGIFPHAKVALASVATMKGFDAKIDMTTGTVTRHNYIQKKAGQKAEFHHVYGAVIVELMPDGSHYCRHLLGDDEDGSFYDLIYYVSGGNVENKQGSTVSAITYGDIHREKMDAEAADMSFGDNDYSLLNVLEPSYQFLHDVTDGSSRNHHNIKDPHFMFKMHKEGTESVREDLRMTYELLVDIQRDFCKTVVVESNHHSVLVNWLKNSDYKKDPVNAMFFLKAQYDTYWAMEIGDSDFDIYKHSLTTYFGNSINDVIFIPEDGSFKLQDIENGLHGHRGLNGARGSALSFTKIGSKVNVGHGHSAAILDGVYVSGVIGRLDMGYNKGPSSWSHSNILTYASSKRTIVTMRNGRFHAPFEVTEDE